MDNYNLAGLILVVLSLIANAYWQDAVRWENERRNAVKSNKKAHVEKAKTYKRNAKILFRIMCGLGSITTLSISVLSLQSAESFPEYLLCIVLLLLTGAFAFYTITPKYFSPIEFPEDLENKDGVL